MASDQRKALRSEGDLVRATAELAKRLEDAIAKAAEWRKAHPLGVVGQAPRPSQVVPRQNLIRRN